MFSFIKNALFGSYSWMSHMTFIESSAVTTAFWLDQYGDRFASIFRRCPPSMFWGQWLDPFTAWVVYLYGLQSWQIRIFFKIEGASGQEILYGGGGAVKLDSMWQHRLTRPLHVQHTYYHIIYKQNPFNIISRGVQRWNSTDFRLK